MINKKELEKLFSKEGINLYHAIASDDVYKTKCLQLAKFNIEDFIKFIKDNKILMVFYEYFYYNEDV